MSNDMRSCPFCGVQLEINGAELNTQKERVENYRHPIDNNAITREDICPLSMLVFAADKWNTRPIEDALQAENNQLKEDLKTLDDYYKMKIDRLHHRSDQQNEDAKLLYERYQASRAEDTDLRREIVRLKKLLRNNGIEYTNE